MDTEGNLRGKTTDRMMVMQMLDERGSEVVFWRGFGHVEKMV